MGSKWLDGGCVKITSTVIQVFSKSDLKVNMRFVLAFAILVVLHQTWADDSQNEEYDIEDMVILEAQESTPQNARSSRQFVSRPYIVGGRAIPFYPSQGTRVGNVNNIGRWGEIGSSCRTQDGDWGVCKNINDCHPERKIFKIKPKDNWIFGLYNSCTHNTARGQQVFGVCCTKNITQGKRPPKIVDAQELRRVNLSAKKCTPMPTKHQCTYDGRRIVNGGETAKNAYPFMAALMRVSSYSQKPRQFCGGSLIDESHILTAAHCIEGFSASDVKTLRIYLGAHDIKSEYDGHSVHRVIRIIKHKDFNPKTLVNDIAILTLETAAKISRTIKTVCLPSVDISHEREYVTVACWGATSEGGGQPNKLHEVRVKVWSNTDCGNKYNKRIPGKIESNMLCASDSGKDSCSGDSGGPLYMTRNSYLVQLGIVSWGIGCARADSPGVYTRVTKMMGWIRRIQNCY